VKFKTPLLLLGLFAWVVFIVLVPPKPFTDGDRKPDHAPVAPVDLRSRVRHATPAKPEATAASGSASAKSRSADPQHREAARGAIDAAVVTYSPEGVKAIRPYLLDADPEVRAAARDGMVQLGEGDAIPLLRDAASKLEDAQEIASLQEAADLLALPAWADSEEAAAVIAGIRAEVENEE
jgi:hypothetical protein